VSTIFSKAVATVSGTTEVKLNLSENTTWKKDEARCFIFEGAATGKAALKVFIKRGNTPITADTAGAKVYLDIKEFKDLYEHWTAGDTDARGAAVAATATHPSDNTFEYGANGDGLSMPGAATYNDYVLFVHGYRMQPWERRAFAETALKRMYHQGYKGKFGFFSWPTEWVDYDHADWKTAKNAAWDPQLYDRCEVQGRKSGNGPLHGLLTSLNGRFGTAHVDVFAHSMGNVVVSEALKAHPAGNLLINRYIASQSAEVAHCYDQNATTNSVTSSIPDLYRYNPPGSRFVEDQLETTGDNYHKGISSRVVNKFINFANLSDHALDIWDKNQLLKPDDSWWPSDTTFSYEPIGTYEFIPPDNFNLHLKITDHYFEDPPGITGENQKHEIFWPADGFTLLAHVIPARSRATGATSGMGGEFDSEVDLHQEPYLFGDGKYDHSAQFQSTFMKRRSYYHQLLLRFDLKPNQL